MKSCCKFVPLLAFIYCHYAHATTNPSRILDANDNKEISLVHLMGKEKFPLSIAERRFKRNVGTIVSVVQDWSSLCTQLCRAGLGGPSCGPHCTPLDRTLLDETDTLGAGYLLGTKKHQICEDLCQFALGGTVCSCKAAVAKGKKNSDKNVICRTFCENNGMSLNGCSPCQRILDVSLDATSTPTTSTTPDWREVCKILCKTGDGGALCNCDLPPLL